MAAALLGQRAHNQQGTEVVASAAFVPGRDWLVVVEQPVSEAFAAARAMKRDLLLLGAATLVLVVLCGILFGRTAVRSLERLRAHTHILAAGDLDARIDTRTPLLEARALGEALNEMASSLKKLHDEARNRERLSTFSRVAAGLAHDLRNPIRGAAHRGGPHRRQPGRSGSARAVPLGQRHRDAQAQAIHG